MSENLEEKIKSQLPKTDEDRVIQELEIYIRDLNKAENYEHSQRVKQRIEEIRNNGLNGKKY